MHVGGGGGFHVRSVESHDCIDQLSVSGRCIQGRGNPDTFIICNLFFKPHVCVCGGGQLLCFLCVEEVAEQSCDRGWRRWRSRLTERRRSNKQHNTSINPVCISQSMMGSVVPALKRGNSRHSAERPEQWSPNYGPRAGSSPPPHLDRPPEQYQTRSDSLFFSPGPLPLRLQ